MKALAALLLALGLAHAGIISAEFGGTGRAAQASGRILTDSSLRVVGYRTPAQLGLVTTSTLGDSLNGRLVSYLLRADFDDSVHHYILAPTGAAQALGQGNSPTFASLTLTGTANISGDMGLGTTASHIGGFTHFEANNLLFDLDWSGTLLFRMTAITGTGVLLQGTTNEDMIFYRNNSEKIRATTSGATITGTVASTDLSGTTGPTCHDAFGNLKTWTSYPITGSCP